MNEILAAFAEHGLNPGFIVCDGKIHRFSSGKDDKRSSAWYVAHQNHALKSGELFHVVVFGSFHTGMTTTFQTGGISYTADDRKHIREQIAKAKKAEEQARALVHDQASSDVEALWAQFSVTGSSEYLERKLLQECPNLGIRFDAAGNFYVPMRDAKGKMWSLQRIAPEGQKLFHAGGRVRGCFHALGDMGRATRIYIAEGFATAASIHLATACPVVCAFNAGNLESVARECAAGFPDASFVVCGDDDLWTQNNPGRKAAEAAAKALLGTAVFPKFERAFDPQVKGGTDFNDLHVSEGIEAVRGQFEEAPEPVKHYVLALGHKGDDYFFTTSSNQQIVKTAALTKTSCLNMMPLEYWESVYPGSGSAKIDWDRAASNLMSAGRSRGLFELQKVRGAGVWNDDGRIVINMGNGLIVDGQPVPLGQIKSRYFYTLGVRLPPLSSRPLSVEECEPIVKACKLFRWKKPDFGYLLAGAMVTTRVCGALPIRPHIWLTGERGSGKTTLFNRLIYPLIGEPMLYAAGNSSEAGIRQDVSANAIPVLIDEFENNGPKSAETIKSILDLMRVAWSDTFASVMKGSASGTAMAYQARFAAIVTSIRQVSMSDADRSRFATLELNGHGSDPEHWRALSAMLDQITIEYGNRLFARTVRLLPVLLENFGRMKAALNRRSPGQRFGDQFGMLLAGYCLLLQDDPIVVSQADHIAGEVSLDEEREDSKIVDQDDALSHMLTTKISYETAHGRQEALIGDLIHRARMGNDAAREALLLTGIHVLSEFVSIVSRNHAELEARVFRTSPWSKCWAQSLARLPGAKPNHAIWISPRTVKAVRIPIEHCINKEYS